MALEIRIHLDPTPSRVRALLTGGLLLWGAPLEIGSQTMGVNAAHPSPSGVYNRIITTGGGRMPNTVLNRNGSYTIISPNVSNAAGLVGIGMTNPNASFKLDVAGNVYVKDSNDATVKPARLYASGVVYMGAAVVNGPVHGYLGDGTHLAARIPGGTGRVAVQNGAGGTTYARFGPTQGVAAGPGGTIDGDIGLTTPNSMKVCTYRSMTVFSGAGVYSACQSGEYPFDVRVWDPAGAPPDITVDHWESSTFRTSPFIPGPVGGVNPQALCCRLRY